MALFIATRVQADGTYDRIGYDEFDTVIVRARNEAQAREIVLTRYWEAHYGDGELTAPSRSPQAYHGFTERNIKIERVQATGPAAEICASFNAG